MGHTNNPGTHEAEADGLHKLESNLGYIKSIPSLGYKGEFLI